MNMVALSKQAVPIYSAGQLSGFVTKCNAVHGILHVI